MGEKAAGGDLREDFGCECPGGAVANGAEEDVGDERHDRNVQIGSVIVVNGHSVLNGWDGTGVAIHVVGIIIHTHIIHTVITSGGRHRSSRIRHAGINHQSLPTLVKIRKQNPLNLGLHVTIIHGEIHPQTRHPTSDEGRDRSGTVRQRVFEGGGGEADDGIVGEAFAGGGGVEDGGGGGGVPECGDGSCRGLWLWLLWL